MCVNESREKPTQLTVCQSFVFSLPFYHYKSAFSLLFSCMVLATHIVYWLEHLIIASISTSIFCLYLLYVTIVFNVFVKLGLYHVYCKVSVVVYESVNILSII